MIVNLQAKSQLLKLAVFSVWRLDKWCAVLYIIKAMVKVIIARIRKRYNPKYASYKERLRDQAH
jgi:hypothetical protein